MIRQLLVNYPFFLSFFFFPLLGLLRALEFIDYPGWLVDIFYMIGFLLLLLFHLCSTRPLVFKVHTFALIISIAFVLSLCSVLLWTQWHNGAPVINFAVFSGIKIFAYVLYSFVYIKVLGPVSVSRIIRFGVILSGLATVSFVLESLNAGYLRVPSVTGDRNYAATIIALCLLVLVLNPNNRFSSRLDLFFWFKFFVLSVGVFVCQSRTVVFALFVSILLGLPSIRVSVRRFILFLVFPLLCASFALSYALRGIVLDLSDLSASSGLDRFDMWYTFFILAKTNPWALLWPHPLSLPLPVEVPASLAVLWSEQVEGASLPAGVYPFNFHSFYIRIITSLGFVLSLVLIASGLYFARRNWLSLNAPHYKSFVSFVAICSLTHGMFYVSDISIPSLIVLASFPSFGSSRGRASAVQLL